MDDARPASKAESPPVALWAIALLALSPFPVAALLYCYGPAEYHGGALTSLLAWSTAVLSFLGGVRWGLETREARPRWMRQAFSALCAVAAWVILLARGADAGARETPASRCADLRSGATPPPNPPPSRRRIMCFQRITRLGNARAAVVVPSRYALIAFSRARARETQAAPVIAVDSIG